LPSHVVLAPDENQRFDPARSQGGQAAL